MYKKLVIEPYQEPPFREERQGLHCLEIRVCRSAISKLSDPEVCRCIFHYLAWMHQQSIDTCHNFLKQNSELTLQAKVQTLRGLSRIEREIR